MAAARCGPAVRGSFPAVRPMPCRLVHLRPVVGRRRLVEPELQLRRRSRRQHRRRLRRLADVLEDPLDHRPVQHESDDASAHRTSGTSGGGIRRSAPAASPSSGPPRGAGSTEAKAHRVRQDWPPAAPCSRAPTRAAAGSPQPARPTPLPPRAAPHGAPARRSSGACADGEKSPTAPAGPAVRSGSAAAPCGHRGCAAPAVDQSPFVEAAEPLLAQRRPCAVAYQPLEALAVPTRDRHRGIDRPAASVI